jgi:2-polyprenyl-3-methyl-5-hydroxy-6-metoxy-1,4-benzoquinol methylase
LSRACEVCGADDFAPLILEGRYQWERCSSCGFVRLQDLLSLDDAIDTENHHAAGYAELSVRKFVSKMRRNRRRAKRMWRRRPGNRFLDVGSNFGFMVEAAAECGFDAVGVEIAADLAETARKRFPSREFRAGALEQQDFGDQRFDCVYCSEVIEHTVDPRAFAKGIAAVMPPGGLLYLTTPHVREYEKRGWQGMGAPGHKIYFDNDNIARLLRAAGFATVKHDFTFWRGIKLWAVKG